MTPADEDDFSADLDDADIEMEMEAEAAAPPVPLAAPGRPRSASGGGRRKNLLAAVLVLVLAGLGGGYYYLTMMTDIDMPPPPQQAAVTPPAAPVEQPAPMEQASAETPAEDTLAENMLAEAADGLPPPPAADMADATAVEDITAAQGETAPAPEAGPIGGEAPPEGDVLAFVDDDAPAPSAVMPDHLAESAPVVEEVPAEAIPATPDDAQAAVSPAEEDENTAPGILPAPTGTAQVAAAPADVSAASVSADVPVVTNEAPPAFPSDQAAAPATQQDAAVSAPPVEVAPGVSDTAEAAVPDAAVSAVSDSAAPAVSDAAVSAAEPDAAEKALVENAQILDKVSTPDTAAAQKEAGIAAQAAIVRPLPGRYVVVRRDSEAQGLDARLTAARAALASGRHQAALELFSDLERSYPNNSNILMGRAISLQSLGQYDSALEAYEAVLRREPKNLEALTNMLGLLKEQDPAFAVTRLEELHDAYPASADIAAQLGVAHGVVGNYGEALKYLDVADTLSPGSATITFNKAVVYDKMGNGIRAAELYRQILSRVSAGTLTEQLPLDAIRARLATIR